MFYFRNLVSKSDYPNTHISILLLLTWSIYLTNKLGEINQKDMENIPDWVFLIQKPVLKDTE